MPFLHNHWYVAAWADELEEGLVSRKILGQQITLFRSAENKAIAVTDVCPHRFAPLHKGKVVDGTIECPYHGLRFDQHGKCVANPDGGHLPRGASLKTYAVVERWNCIWIWLGDQAQVDESLLPRYPFLSDPEHYRRVSGYLKVNANYQLCIDNVLDPAHVRMVHRNTLYCEKLSDAKTILIRGEDGAIWSNRLVEATPPPPVFEMMWRSARGEADELMDHWLDARWNAPSLVHDDVGVTLHGRPREEGIETKATHFFTPETESTTHYFWAICRDFDLDKPEFDADVRAATEYAFINEDEVMLRAVQEAMGDRNFWDLRPALIPSDVGSVEARRALDRLITAEREELLASTNAQVDGEP